MIRALTLALCLPPVLAVAQQPQPEQHSSQAMLAGQLATVLSETMAQRDALQVQVADLQRQLEAAKKTAETPKP